MPELSPYITRLHKFERGGVYNAALGGCPGLPIAFTTLSNAVANTNEVWQLGSNGGSCAIIRRTSGYLHKPGVDVSLEHCEIKFQQASSPHPACGSGGHPSLAIGADGSVFYADDTGLLYKYSRTKSTFKLFRSSPLLTNASRVAVDPSGRPWVIDTNNTVRQYNGNQFIARPQIGLPQKAVRIAIGANGSVYVVDTAGRLLRYNTTNDAFDRISEISGVKDIAVGRDGLPWAVTATNNVLQGIPQ